MAEDLPYSKKEMVLQALKSCTFMVISRTEGHILETGCYMPCMNKLHDQRM